MLLEQEEEARKNDPEVKLKNLKMPQHHGVKHETLMKQLGAILSDSSKLEVATLFKVNYTPNNISNKINLDKYDYEAKGSFLMQSNISSAEQLKHALKSR